jgi:murein DD-endopeptidase MepM/ murein hydrolase activator NlpD
MRRGIVLAAVICVVAVLVAAALITLFAAPWGPGRLTARETSPAPAPVVAGAPVPPPRVSDLPIRRGDTLESVLRRGGLTARQAAEASTALARAGADLRRLNPRDALSLTWTHAGAPAALDWAPSAWLAWVARPARDGWEVRRVETEPEVRVETVRGRVTRSLFHAMEEAGEAPQLAIDLAEIFASDFDFTADTRPGDRFRALVEKRYASGRFVDYGRIRVAQYTSEGRTLTGIGWEGRRGLAHYDPEGRSLRKSFLKSPLEFTRITSGFTYARPHPILGGVRPHLAIDYAAPVGTPVRAVADGRVLRAGWNGGNGIQVHLRHRAGYETVYNHLSRLGPGIRAGASIAQRRVIGFVGATGLATGPHLDYRIRKNGVFVNPLAERFVPGDPIAPGEREAFLARARALLHRLEAQAPAE